MTKSLNIIFVILLIIFSGCTRNNKKNENKILVKVGNKTITIKEFVQRSEYTLRPPYCRNNNYIHKKIILNSLIGEKLLALEAGENNELNRNADFQAYLEGRKEQAMRQVHYYEEAYKKTEITPEEIKNEYNVAGRRYKLSYFTVPDEKISTQISQKLRNENISFDEVYYYISGDTIIPHREIQWQDPENSQIQ